MPGVHHLAGMDHESANIADLGQSSCKVELLHGMENFGFPHQLEEICTERLTSFLVELASANTTLMIEAFVEKIKALSTLVVVAVSEVLIVAVAVDVKNLIP